MICVCVCVSELNKCRTVLPIELPFGGYDIDHCPVLNIRLSAAEIKNIMLPSTAGQRILKTIPRLCFHICLCPFPILCVLVYLPKRYTCNVAHVEKILLSTARKYILNSFLSQRSLNGDEKCLI